MATSSFTSRVARRVALYTTAKASLKGELLAATSSLWFLLFLLVPLLIVVFFGFATVNNDLTISYTQLTGANYIRALDPFGQVAGLALRTILVAMVAALGSLAVAFPISYYLARVCKEERRGVLVSLFVIPFWISFVVQVYAILPWVQRGGYIGGILDWLHLGGFADWLFANFGVGTPNIVAPALIYIWLPFMILPLFTALLKIDPALIEAAQDLGAGKWKTFWHVTVPLSYNGILTGSILVFITAFGSFVEPKILAGKNGLLVGNYIYNAFLQFGYLPNGAAASVVVLVPTIVLLYFYVAYAQAPVAGVSRESLIGNALRRLLDWIGAALGKVGAKATRDPEVGDGVAARAPSRGRLERYFDRVSAHHGSRILTVYTLLVLAAFYVPLAQVVLFSFNHDNNIINWSYLSLRWYAPSKGVEFVPSLFGDKAMLDALKNSLFIGVVVTTISLAVGIPASLAVVRYRFGTKPFLNLMLYTGLVMPSIILGVSILVFIRFLNDAYLWPYFGTFWDFGYASIIAGHVTFCIPIVIVVLVVSLREFDRSIEEAAMNLGADEITTFLRVTIPNIMPGVISAALLSFTFSFSEVVVTLFLKGGGINTLPVVFWATLSKHIPTPELNAASTLILALSIAFVVIANKVQRGGTLYRF